MAKLIIPFIPRHRRELAKEARLDKCINAAWKFAHCALWPEQEFNSDEEQAVVAYIKVSSIAQILTMTALDQLDLVKWYLSPYRNRMKSYYDVYAVTFFPSMIGKPDDWVLQTKTLSAGTIARQNKGIAKGKTFITVADFKHYTVNLVPKSLRERVFGVMQQAVQNAEEEVVKAADSIKNHPKESTGVGTGIIIGICLLGWFFLRKG